MSNRIELHEELCKLLGSRNVYFQPPETLKMKYPCIRYKLNSINTKRANNKVYLSTNGYKITFIDTDPESDYITKMFETFSYVSFDSFYTADNLNHWVFTLFY